MSLTERNPTVPAEPGPADYEALARELTLAGEAADGLTVAQMGERLATARGERAVAAWCLLHQARALAGLGDSRCAGVARAAVRALRAESCWEGLAQAHALLARRLVQSGAEGVVEELAGAAVALDAVTRPSVGAAEAHAELAVAEAALGLVERAAAHARVAVALADELGAPEDVSLRAVAIHGDVVRQQVAEARRANDDDRVRTLALDWLAHWPRLETRLRRSPALWPPLALTAATLLVDVGDELVRALALLDELWRRADDRADTAVATLGQLARVNLRTGHLTAAHALLDDAERRAVAARLHEPLAELARIRSAVHEAGGDADAALRAFKRYHQYVVAEGDTARRRQADAVRARVAELVQHSVASALAEVANTDALTGLHNRRFLDAEAPGLVELRRDRGDAVSVAVIDVDKFKHVNDHYGHPVGDAVLVVVGELLRSGLRDGDLVIRTGGDEFVLVLFGTPMDRAHAVLERVRHSVQEADWAGRGLPAVTLTIGATALEPTQALPDAIGAADLELLSAKRAGRNTVHSPAARPPGTGPVGAGDDQ